MPTLSKSRFLSGLQCEKKMYFEVSRKDLKPQIDASQQALFDLGHSIGQLAQQAFPGGLDATTGMQGNWSLAIQRTKEWLQSGQTTIYEATFSQSGGFAALDILHHRDGERWAIEVKTSTEVKEYHLQDAAFQYHVMCAAGFTPDKFFLMHINNRYQKKGPIDPADYFHLEDITLNVKELQETIHQKKASFLQLLETNIEPIRAIGPHCNQPFACPFQHHCYAHLPENNVLELLNARGKSWELYQLGIWSLADVPADFALTHRQQLQVSGKPYLDLDRLKQFLEPIQAPLYFLDFETFFPAIPVLDGTRPFEQVPFQYSLHITDLDGNLLEHRSFLANPADFNDPDQPDPRMQLFTQLRQDLGSSGTIIAYNAGFEQSILKGLSAAFSEETFYFEGVKERFADLLVPFRSGWYYLPEMGSSASIKSVLPAIAPTFSYENLRIADGGQASFVFHALVTHTYTDDLETVRQDLLDYCHRDTQGMVLIYQHLKALTKR